MEYRISTYHKGLRSLISQVFDGNVVYEPVDTAFEYAVAQSKENKLTFPYISFYALPSIELDDKNNSMPGYRDGYPFEKALSVYNDQQDLEKTSDRMAKSLQTLYIIVDYQFDVWGKTREQAEDLIQELVFWFYHNQEVTVKYQDEPLTFTFSTGENIVDNSDLTQRTEIGPLYRFTFMVSLQATLLRAHTMFNVLKPDISIEIEQTEV